VHPAELLFDGISADSLRTRHRGLASPRHARAVICHRVHPRHTRKARPSTAARRWESHSQSLPFLTARTIRSVQRSTLRQLTACRLAACRKRTAILWPAVPPQPVTKAITIRRRSRRSERRLRRRVRPDPAHHRDGDEDQVAASRGSWGRRGRAVRPRRSTRCGRPSRGRR
jgi:hypothetical protein